MIDSETKYPRGAILAPVGCEKGRKKADAACAKMDGLVS